MDYFQIPAQELGKNAKIPVYPLGDSGEVFYEMAAGDGGHHPGAQRPGGKNRLHLPRGPGGPVPHFCPAGRTGTELA